MRSFWALSFAACTCCDVVGRRGDGFQDKIEMVTILDVREFLVGLLAHLGAEQLGLVADGGAAWSSRGQAATANTPRTANRRKREDVCVGSGRSDRGGVGTRGPNGSPNRQHYPSYIMTVDGRAEQAEAGER